MREIPEWLTRRAELTPDAPGLIAEGDEWSFAELHDAALRCAARLGAALRGTPTENGVGPRVALLMPNSPAFVVWAHAIPRAGAVLVPLNARLTPAELSWQLDDAGAAALIYHDQYRDTVHAIAAELPGLRLLDGTEVERPSPPLASGRATLAGPGPMVGLDSAHSIVYTSGTTGRPKGAILTYGNHWWSATASVLNLGLAPGDRWLASMPLFHVGGLAILLRSVIYGIPVVLHERFDPKAVDRDLARGAATLVSLVATMLERVLEVHDGTGYPALRAVLLGGGPAPEPLLRQAMTLGIPVLQTYGLTEAASQVATLAPDDALRRLGSAGKPLFPTSVRILTGPEMGGQAPQTTQGLQSPQSPQNPQNPQSPQNPHSPQSPRIGEIVISGPTITPGYWKRPEETAAALRNGWFHTGDLGYLDGDGHLYVVDRRSDLFISGGENVYPAEIEAVLRTHPEVLDVGVVGVPDERWGRVPIAAIVTVRDRSPDLDVALRSLCEAKLARYKVPKGFLTVDELPRNATGKLLRDRLAEYIADPR